MKCDEQAVTASSPSLINGKYSTLTCIDILEQQLSERALQSERRLCLIGGQASGFLICKNNLLQSTGTVIIEWQMHFRAF